MNLIGDSDALVEGDQVGVGADQRMLAVVDDFVDAGVEVGGCTAPEIAAAFNELHAITGLG